MSELRWDARTNPTMIVVNNERAQCISCGWVADATGPAASQAIRDALDRHSLRCPKTRLPR